MDGKLDNWQLCTGHGGTKETELLSFTEALASINANFILYKFKYIIQIYIAPKSWTEYEVLKLWLELGLLVYRWSENCEFQPKSRF